MLITELNYRKKKRKSLKYISHIYKHTIYNIYVFYNTLYYYIYVYNVYYNVPICNYNVTILYIIYYFVTYIHNTSSWIYLEREENEGKSKNDLVFQTSKQLKKKKKTKNFK